MPTQCSPTARVQVIPPEPKKADKPKPAAPTAPATGEEAKKPPEQQPPASSTPPPATHTATPAAEAPGPGPMEVEPPVTPPSVPTPPPTMPAPPPPPAQSPPPTPAVPVQPTPPPDATTAGSAPAPVEGAPGATPTPTPSSTPAPAPAEPEKPKTRIVKKKRTITLKSRVKSNEASPEVMQAAVQRHAQLLAEAQARREKMAAMNALEQYTYEMPRNLNGRLNRYISPEVRAGGYSMPCRLRIPSHLKLLSVWLAIIDWLNYRPRSLPCHFGLPGGHPLRTRASFWRRSKRRDSGWMAKAKIHLSRRAPTPSA